MAAPAQTTSDAQDPTASADPVALAAFVSRRGGRVLAYLDAVTAPDRALQAAGEAFASFRLARAADPEAEAAATTLLRATRRAATAHAENPYRPDGRERPERRTAACAAMPRLLVAWTEARLPDADVARLVEHLQACPDCRAMRDAFDRAELGYRAGEAADLDGTEVGVIASAMALAVSPPQADDPAPAGRVEAPRGRTTVPDPSAAAARPRRTGLPAAGRRTEIPAPPTAVPARPTALPPRPTPAAHGTTAVPERRTAVPAPRAATSDPSVAPRPAATPTPTDEPRRPAHRTPATDGAGAPEDPLGPEALGYAVPRSGLPRPERRPAVPRVRRRRRRRPQSPEVVASVAATPEAPNAPDGTPVPGRATTDAAPAAAIASTPARDRTVAPRDAAAARHRSASPATDAPDAVRPERRSAVPDGRTDAPDERDARVPRRDDPPKGPASHPDPTAAREDDRDARPAVVPATVTSGGLATTGRRVLEVPLVRQLGVPAVLLLAVLIAALIAAGVFAGQQEESVAPITRPTIPTVPADPSDIPSLR